MGRKRVTAAKKRVLRSATTKNIGFLIEKLPELQKPDSKNGQATKKVKFQSNIDAQDVESEPELLLNVDMEFEKDMGHISSDTDDDSPCKPPTMPFLNPRIRTYRRRITIDELLEDWNTDEPNATNSAIGQSLKESSEPVGKTDNSTGCSCGMANEAKKYKDLYESLCKDMLDKESQLADNSAKEKLLKENAELVGRNAKLQEALTSKLLPQPVAPFKDVKGDFLDAETIRSLSIEADTDYLFIKFLMMRLWPDGFTGRSVTGRRSNNPSGRSKSTKSSDDGNTSSLMELSGSSSVNSSEETADGTPKRPLEKDKVDFVISCLYRRRIFLQDDANTAQVHTKAGISLMTRVIANSMRK